jgi:putative nucleotidyltransferase with HDIG domain
VSGTPESLAALAASLAPVAEAAPGGAWLVGGAVRDALLADEGTPTAARDERLDLDVAVAGDAGAASAALARARGATRFRLSREFGAWRVQGGELDGQVDITPLQGATLAEDLARRDLTVNAIALPLGIPGAALVDPTGGLSDLGARRLRAASRDALRADAVRLLRLPRLAVQLGMEVDEATAALAREAAPALWEAPGERLADELLRIARLAAPHEAFALMDRLGSLEALAPELGDCRGLDQSAYHHKDVLGHTLEVVEHLAEIVADPEPVFRGRADRVAEVLARPLADGMTAGQALMLPGLLHDMAKAATRGVTPEGRVTFIGHDRLGAQMAEELMRRLRVATRLREFVVRCIRWHLPLGFMVHRTPLSLRQIDRYLRLTAPSEAEVIVLTVADRLATRGPRTSRSAITRHLALAREVMDVHFTLLDRGPPERLLSGDEIARALGRAPGPWLAALLDALREGQVVGAIRTREQALRFARGFESHL